MLVEFWTYLFRTKQFAQLFVVCFEFFAQKRVDHAPEKKRVANEDNAVATHVLDVLQDSVHP